MFTITKTYPPFGKSINKRLHNFSSSFFMLRVFVSGITLLLVLLGCSKKDEEMYLTVSSNQINFVGVVNGATPESQSVDFKIFNLSPPVYVGGGYKNLGIDSVELEHTGKDTGRLWIHPRPPGSVSDISYEGFLELDVCEDAYCRHHISGSPQKIKVSYHIIPTIEISLSKNSVFLTALEGEESNVEQITVSSNIDSLTNWSASVSYNTGNGWLSLNRNGNQLSLHALPVTHGIYRANVNITYAGTSSTETVQIPVTLNANPILSVSNPNLNFNSIEGDRPDAQSFDPIFDSSTIQAWRTELQYPDGTAWLEVTETTSTVSARPYPLPAGTYLANILIHYSPSPNLQSTIAVPVLYIVSRGVSVAETSLQLSAIEGVGVTGIPIAINYTGSAEISWDANITYQDGKDWLSLNQMNGTSLPATLLLSAHPLPAGSYNAAINFNYSFASYSQTISIPVSYTTTTAWLLPSDITFNIDNASNPTDVQQQLPISNIDMTWTAALSDSWAKVSMSSGNTTGDNLLTLALDGGDIGARLTNSYNMLLTMTSDNPNVTPLTVPVSLSLALPEVNYVMPYVEYENTVGKDYKVIRGKGFTGFQQNVSFSGNAAVNVEVISDTEIHATPPALAAGNYNVVAENVLGIALTQAKLVVKSEPTFASESIGINAGLLKRVVYDEEREVVFAVQCDTCAGSTIPAGTSSTVFRFEYQNGWQITPYSFAGVTDIALAPDGKSLLVLAGDLYLVDPVTMNTLSSVVLDLNAESVAVLNDGEVFLCESSNLLLPYVPCSSYSLVNGGDLKFATPFGPFSLDKNWLDTSPDGGRIVSGNRSSATSVSLTYYDTPNELWSYMDLNTTYAGFSQFSTHADRQFIGDVLYDKDFNAIGQVPTGFVVSSGNAMSKDGSTLYGFDASTSQLQIVDVSAAPPFSNITSFPIANPGAHLSTVNVSASHMFKVGENLFMVINIGQL